MSDFATQYCHIYKYCPWQWFNDQMPLSCFSNMSFGLSIKSPNIYQLYPENQFYILVHIDQVLIMWSTMTKFKLCAPQYKPSFTNRKYYFTLYVLKNMPIFLVHIDQFFSIWSTLTKIFQWGPHWPKFFNVVHNDQ